MTLMDDKIKLFTGLAKSQGYADEEVQAMAGLAKIKAEEDESTDLTTDPVYQRQVAAEDFKSQQEGENYVAGLTNLEDLSEGGKAYLRDKGVELPKIPVKLSTTEQSKYESAKNIKSAAQNVLDTLALIDSGKLTGKAAQDALNAIATGVTKTVFESGGKQLTPMEQAVLQGAIPTVEPTKEVGSLGKLFNYTPKAAPGKLNKTEVENNYATLRTKMLVAQKVAEQNIARAEGNQNSTLDLTGLNQELSEINYNEKQNAFNLKDAAMGLWINPMINATKNYLELAGMAVGTLALPAVSKISPEAGSNLADLMEPIAQNKYATIGSTVLNGGLATLGGAVVAADVYTMGAASKLTGVLGLSARVAEIGARNMMINAPIFGLGESIKAAKNGEDVGEAAFKGLTGQSFTGPMVALYGETPTTQAADVVLTVLVPILGERALNSIWTSTQNKLTQKFGPKAPPTDLPSTPQEIQPMSVKQKLGLTKEDVTGKSIVGTLSLKSSERESLSRLEDLGKKTYAMTQSDSPSGMAKEMPTIRTQAGNFIKSESSNVDAITSPKNTLEVSNNISDTVKGTTAIEADLATNNGKIFKQFQKYLNGLLLKKDTASGLTVSQMNTARMKLNSKISSSWFAQGQPLVTPADALNSSYWTASNTLKDLIINTPGAEKIGQAITIQHVTYAMEPILTRTATVPKNSLGGGMWGTFINMVGGMVKKVTTPIKTEFLRKASQKLLPDITNLSKEIQGLPSIPQALPGGGGLPMRPYLYK